jgi:hypothetical protein
MKKLLGLACVLAILGVGGFLLSPTTSIPKDSIGAVDDPIVQYLINGPEGQGARGGGVVFASYELIGEADQGQTKYIWAAVEAYTRENGEPKLGSGSWLPLVIHLTKNGTVGSAEEPGDGNLYMPGIKRLFPPLVQAKILLRSKGIGTDAAHENNLKQAEAYFFLQDQYPPPYRSLFSRDATPEWRSVHVGGFHVSIPYSTNWKVSETGISVFDTGTDESGIGIIFGRPQDNGTFIFRQYALSRTTKVKGIFPPDMTLMSMSSMCGEPERISLGKIQGIKFFNGGAKGCYIGFTFNISTHTYELRKIPDIGDNPSQVIDEEMTKIIQSIYE